MADAMGGGPVPTTRKRRRNETQELTRPIEAALNRLPGVWAARNNTGALPAMGAGGRRVIVRYGLGIGSADIVGCVRIGARAQFFALEVKWPGKALKPEQEMWAKRLRSVGAIVEIVHSVDEAVSVVKRIQSAT